MSGRRAGSGRFARFTVVILAGILIVSCGDDGGVKEDRRFANDPTEAGSAPTLTPTTEVTATVAGDESAETGPETNPALLVDARGAPDGFYSLDDSEINAVTIDGSESAIQSWTAPEGQRFLAIDGAPGLAQVAALVDVGGNRLDLVIYDRAGTEVRRIESVLGVPSLETTPFTDGTTGAASADFGVSVSWSPLGDAILVGSSRGELRSLSLEDGDITTFEPSANLEGLVLAEWSPQGNAIAALVRDRTGVGRLSTFEVEGSTLTGTNLVDLEHLPQGNSVEDFAWNADGDRMFFVVADRQDGTVSGGQVYSTTIADRKTTLVLTSGRGGPSGSIGSIEPSPDGNAIAVVIAVQDRTGARFHSLIVRSLDEGSTYDVPTAAVRQLPAVRWVDGGLAWLAPAGDGWAVTMATDDGAVAQLSAMSSSSSASPVASPVDEATPAVRG
jgi:dipeptidyl aminopeptidase/acylaminoacyl peptidase